MHHSPCFNLLLLYNNSFDNQESEINENEIFTFRHTAYIYIYIYIHKYGWLTNFFVSDIIFSKVSRKIDKKALTD